MVASDLLLCISLSWKNRCRQTSIRAIPATLTSVHMQQWSEGMFSPRPRLMLGNLGSPGARGSCSQSIRAREHGTTAESADSADFCFQKPQLRLRNTDSHLSGRSLARTALGIGILHGSLRF